MRLKPVLLVGVLLSSVHARAAAPDHRQTFVNPVYEGADPWITMHEGTYYYCRSEGDLAISVWKSDRLTDPGIKRVVWECPRDSWNSRQLWAPELHRVRGKWYIYYAASDGKNENHRTGVLEAVSDDPQGQYTDRGIVYTGDDYQGSTNNRWSIDATPAEIGGKLYMLWSGWPDHRDIQYLYIAPMSNPYTVAGNRVKICENDTYLWERVGESSNERGLHEAPQILKRAGKVLVVYSCSGSWEPSYKLGLLTIDEGADPLLPENWHKHDKPVFAPTKHTFGVGHCSFVKSPDGREDWIIYHAKQSRAHGWERAVYMQPFTWTAQGLPDFGKPVAAGEPLPLPSGEAGPQPGESCTDDFESGNWDSWRYYGYGRYIWVENGTLSLGGHPKWGLVNHFKSGEKAVVRGLEFDDFEASVRIRLVSGERDAGILFRVAHPSVGYDAQKGYFAGLIAGTQIVVLGKTDGKEWTEIGRSDCRFDAPGWHELRVQAQGEVITVSVDGDRVLEARDRNYRSGSVGLRVVDTHALFDDFKVDRR